MLSSSIQDPTHFTKYQRQSKSKNIIKNPLASHFIPVYLSTSLVVSHPFLFFQLFSMSKENNWSLLGRLRGAVKKIRFLLNFNVNRWKLASIIGASSGKRRLSFNDRPGLRACMDNDSDSNDSGSARAGGLQRTISYPSDQDDIDKRAEMFIANFYRQLKIERQISLELRYARADSFDSASP